MEKSLKGKIFIVAIIIANSLAQVVYKSCPPIYPKENIDFTKIVGIWYQIEQYSNGNQLNDKCITYNYAFENNQTIKVDIRKIQLHSGSVRNAQIYQVALTNPSQAIARIIFPQDAEQADIIEALIDTDYHNYNVKIGCQVLNDTSSTYSWIESRQTTLHHRYLRYARDVLSQNSIPLSQRKEVNQHHCPNLWKN